jgi:O-acetyl-ADP-ribose deacetylase (regulator of RNase III)
MMPAVPLRIITGDATLPQAGGPVIIAHVCNDEGRWGSGFVLAVSARWPQPEQQYRAWHSSGENFLLGRTQFVLAGEQVTVANMIAQHGTRPPGAAGPAPIRYRALGECLRAVGTEAERQGASVHMPRIGCGLAGGRWELVAPIVDWALCRRGILVTVYDLPTA